MVTLAYLVAILQQVILFALGVAAVVLALMAGF